MSEIKAKLDSDIKSAMKAREKEKLVTLRGISAALKQVEVDSRKELTDDDVLSVINKEIKKRRDSLGFAKEAGRDDLVEQNEAEIKLIQGYVGEEITEDKLRALIQELVDGGAGNIGAVMGGLNQKYKGRFEGKVASALAKEILG